MPATMIPKIGERVEVTQIITRRDDTWETSVIGVIKAIEEKPTGSWFAHGKHGKLWLGRIRLQKDDGEITTLVIDERTRVRNLQSAAESSKSPA